MAGRFGLTYVDASGMEKTPVMIHRALIGSPDRFMGVLIEHYAGAFPVWLSPVQVKILPVSEKHVQYGNEILTELKNAGIRTEIDDANESLGKKIRTAKTEKVPYLMVVGDKEVESKTVTLENRKESEGAQELSKIIERLRQEISNRT